MNGSIALTARRALSAAVLGLVAASAPAFAQYPTEPPPAAPVTPVRFPPFREATLAYGLQIVLVENTELPVVSISLTIPVGSVHDPADMTGLAGMVAELLTKGTPTRTADQIAATIEGVGGSISASAGNDFFSLSTTVLTDHVELAVELLADVLLRATFPAEELELARRRTLSALRLEKSDPGSLADRYFRAALFGDHPYSRSQTEASVQAITREAVVAWARQHLRPRGALLVVAGDMRLDRIRQLAQRRLGEWTGAPPARNYAAAPAPKPTEILLVHRPGSEQSNIVIGNLALRPGDRTYYAATVMNKYLGGGTDARLFQILREQKGWTYGSYASVSRPRDIGNFEATAEVRTEVTDSALGELLMQLKRVRTEAPPAEELEAAKSYLTGVFPLRIETPQQVASQVSAQKRLGLGDDYLSRYRERIAAITAEQARQAARQVVRPDSAVIVVVGEGVAIYEGLKRFAPVRIIDVDGNPLTPDDLSPPAVALTFDPAQLVAGRDSFRVMVQGNPMGTYVAELVRGGDSIVVSELMSIPVIGLAQGGSVVLGRDLAVRTVRQSFAAGGQPVEATLRFAGGRVTGKAIQPPQGPGMPAATRDVDTTLAADVYDSNQLSALLPALPLAEGATFTAQAYTASQNRVRTLTIRVEGTEDVTVPAGTFPVFRVSLTGGEQPLTLYVTRAAPRKVVKLEIVGTPLVIELVQ